MPTSPVPASGDGTSASGGARLRSAAEPQSVRPTEQASEAINAAEGISAEPVIQQSSAQGQTTRGTEATGVEGGELPEAFRPSPEEAMMDVPGAGAGVHVAGEDGDGAGVVGTQDGGGRGPGLTTTVARVPLTGRVERNRSYLTSTRTKRGPKKTAHQRRFAASRPSGHHPLLNPWDLTPLEVRSSAAGQERSIFRTRGLLVSQLDMPTFRMLATFNVGLISEVFPSAPDWWPRDWGHVPITLPWEISRYRSQLVSASSSEPIWQEVYQRFLEQLAGGWDLQFIQAPEKSTLAPLPLELAKTIIDAGGFAFCAGTVASPSFKKFCQLHSIPEETVLDQRGAKNAAWQRIASLRQERSVGGGGRETLAGPGPCQCGAKLTRAVRRLGLEAQMLEVANEEESLEAVRSVEKLAALASAALSFSLESERLTERVDHLLADVNPTAYCRELEDSRAAVRAASTLAEFLPRRYSTNLARLSSSRQSRGSFRG